MSCHIQVKGLSWCQCMLPAALSLSAPRGMALYCEHSSPEKAQPMVEYLRQRGYDAQVVDGPCRQRDEPYYEPYYEAA